MDTFQPLSSKEILLDQLSQVLYEHMGEHHFQLSLIEGRSLNRLFIYEGKGTRYFVKAFLEDKENRNFGKDVRQRYLSEALVLNTCRKSGIPVPQLVKAIDEHLVLVVTYLEGGDLAGLDSHILQQPALPENVALWLHKFHQVFRSKPVKTTFAEYLRYRTPQAIRESQCPPEYTAAYQSLLQTYGDLQISSLKITRNDCHMGNFMLDQDQLVGIDFELCSYQAAEYEVASFLSHYFKQVAVGNHREEIIKLVSAAYAQKNNLYITFRKIKAFLQAKELFNRYKENHFLT